MRFLRRAALAAGAAATLLALAAVSPVRPAVSIRLTKAVPSVIRIGQVVTVNGELRGAWHGARVALEFKRSAGSAAVAWTRPAPDGKFSVAWRVSGSPYVPASWWVRVVRFGVGLNSTPPRSVAIGPAAVYCKPPAPPAVNIPVGDGWIVGGLYGEGGPFPGIYACSSRPYTVTATDRSGKVVASQRVAALHSYTLVVPAGTYALASGGCRGSATVKPGRQTKANTYCLYP